jgi:hypothetical protein
MYIVRKCGKGCELYKAEIIREDPRAHFRSHCLYSARSIQTLRCCISLRAASLLSKPPFKIHMRAYIVDSNRADICAREQLRVSEAGIVFFILFFFFSILHFVDLNNPSFFLFLIILWFFFKITERNGGVTIPGLAQRKFWFNQLFW